MTPLGSRFEKTASRLSEAARLGKPLLPTLHALCPALCRHIEEDGKWPQMLSLWGKSVNVDENTGTTIVSPAILEAIGSIAGVPMKRRIVHAGLQHTYGYLFSLIETPYGNKRDRWVRTDLERGFDLPLSLLGPRPRQGTLLANATWLLGRIAFRDRPRVLEGMHSFADAVAPSLVRLSVDHRAAHRIVEETKAPGRAGRIVTMHTDLVRFPVNPGDGGAESHLLVYSVRNGATASFKLITAFPVTDVVVRLLKNSAKPNGVEVRLRYNAYVPGLFGKTMPGRRQARS